MDTARADLVLQYVIAAAGAREPGSREVTTSQLVKCAYLADVAHAQRNGGATYTLAAWTFSQQGPHAAELEARVAPVVRRTGAATRGAYFSLEEDERGVLREAEATLPAVVTATLSRAVRAFSRDTSGLLAHVYATAPMRRAAPGEAIDFSPEPGAPPPPAAAHAPPPAAPLPRAARAALAARLAAPRAAPPASAAAPLYAPRYGDACFEAGQRALDAAGGRPLAACDGALTIDPALWSSPGRREHDVP